MKHSVSELRDRRQKGKRIKFLFFWGHRPLKDGSTGASCLSQWWPSQFSVEGKVFCSAEQWMMYQKAQLFNDEETAKLILEAKSPTKAKQLGRQVRGFIAKVWEQKKFKIVTQGNLYKFSQNPELKEFLINTKERVLVEASPVDAIWGIGVASDHENAEKPEKWRGENLLGFALMEVRDELRKGQ